jgi:uncharacterized protein
MHSQLPQQDDGLRTFAPDFATGDEVVSLVKQFVAAQNIHAAEITALGGLSDVTLLCFDWDKQEYASIPLQMQLELASLDGQVGQPPGGGDAAVHMHAVVSKNDATAFAGHLGAAHVRPIVQMVIREVGPQLRRALNARTAFLMSRDTR